MAAKGLRLSFWAPDLFSRRTLPTRLTPFSDRFFPGGDPLLYNGRHKELTVSISPTAVPLSYTSATATYELPPGPIAWRVGAYTVTNLQNSTLEYIFQTDGPDKLVVIGNLIDLYGSYAGSLEFDATLANGSFNSSVTQHPMQFSPSPQSLTAATTLGGSGSTAAYKPGRTRLPFWGSRDRFPTKPNPAGPS